MSVASLRAKWLVTIESGPARLEEEELLISESNFNTPEYESGGRLCEEGESGGGKRTCGGLSPWRRRPYSERNMPGKKEDAATAKRLGDGAEEGDAAADDAGDAGDDGAEEDDAGDDGAEEGDAADADDADADDAGDAGKPRRGSNDAE